MLSILLSCSFHAPKRVLSWRHPSTQPSWRHSSTQPSWRHSSTQPSWRQSSTPHWATLPQHTLSLMVHSLQHCDGFNLPGEWNPRPLAPRAETKLICLLMKHVTIPSLTAGCACSSISDAASATSACCDWSGWRAAEVTFWKRRILKEVTFSFSDKNRFKFDAYMSQMISNDICFHKIIQLFCFICLYGFKKPI